jgi:hypothetical protein
MRRTVLLAALAALVAAGLVVAAAGLAGDRAERPATPAAAPPPGEGPFAMAAAEGRAHAIGSRERPGGRHGLHARLVGDLAERLGVREARLRAALRDVKQRARARGVRLRDATPAQLAALKRQLTRDLAGELGVPRERVVAAVRAELEQALGVAVTFGAITKRGRDMALACFDDPAACDLAAMRREHPFRRHGTHR